MGTAKISIPIRSPWNSCKNFDAICRFVYAPRMTAAKPADIKKRQQQLRDLSQALKDEPVGPDDKRYYPFHEAAGEPRGNDPVHTLRTAIEVETTENGSCQLFSGFRGSGKSTELLRLRTELVASGYEVILVEGAQIINLHQALEPADLLVSVAAGVGLALEETGNDSPAKQGIVERLFSFLQNTNVNLTQLHIGASADVAGAKVDLGKFAFEIRTNPTFKTQVQNAFRNRLRELVEQFQSFMTQARQLITKKDPARLPVLIVDDLEKVRGTGPEQDLIQKGMEDLFWQFSFALRIPGWHVIWTAPPYLQLLNSDVTNSYDASIVLPMVRVWQNDEHRSPDAQSIAALKACLRRRGDVDSLVFKEELLDQLIIASSGHLRDLIVLVRDVVKNRYMQKDPREPMNEYQINRLVTEYVNTSNRPVYDDDVPWLRSIAEKRELRLPNEEMLSRASKLIDTAMVMTYRNGNTWFDVSYPVRQRL